MELDFNKIIRLKKIRIEKSELSEEENTLASPILRDKSLIRDIYKIFVELLNSRSLPPCIDSVTQRKKFIFIILYLFSPSSLAGGKMASGLRPEIAKVLGVQSECTISDNCADVVFLYQNYGDFSGDIEYLYTEIGWRKVNCVMRCFSFKLIGRGSASAKGVHQHSRRA